MAKVLQEQLSDIKVYKLGEEAEKAVYIVGKTKGGQWARLKTSVVET
ncbi:MAG TPA: nuclease A inhibitor family protein [Gemmataceae bacterium]|nr:nuclease A inhibitor family protein [Gemmataceae bacterium]